MGTFAHAHEHHGVRPVKISENNSLKQRVLRHRFPPPVQLVEHAGSSGTDIQQPSVLMAIGLPCQPFAPGGGRRRSATAAEAAVAAAAMAAARGVGLWLSEITVCLGRGGWQQNHSAMSPVAELVMSPEYFWWLSLFSVVLAAASTQHRVPTAADRGLSPFLRFCFRSRWCIGSVVRTSELQLSRLWVDFLDADAATEHKLTEAQSF